MTDLILRGPRIHLRPLVRSDAAALFPAFSDPELMRYWSCAPFTSCEALADWLAPAEPWAEGRSWAVVRNGDPDDTATGRFVAIRRREGVSELGYLMTREASGQGLATEATRLLLAQLFDVEGHRRVFADIDPDNIASNRLIERLGFQCEGRMRGEWETHIGIRDSLIWGMLAAEWQLRAGEVVDVSRLRST